MDKKIVIIEDSQRIQELYSYWFEKHGFKVFFAETGEAGIELVKIEKPSLALIDLNLPDQKGTEVVRTIREFDKNIKISIISGADVDYLRQEAIDLGANEVFSKTLDVRVLVDSVIGTLS